MVHHGHWIHRPRPDGLAGRRESAQGRPQGSRMESLRRERFHTRTLWPALSRFAATREPIGPRPMNPMSMVHHPCQNFPLPSGCKAQLPVLARERQREMERRAGTDSAFRPDPAAVRFHNAARDCQSEADATPVAATTLPEFLEQTIEVLLGDAGARAD